MKTASKQLTPLQLLCLRGIFEGTKLIDCTDDQVNRAVLLLAKFRLSKLRINPKRISVSDPDRALLKAEIYNLAQKYIYEKIMHQN